MSTNNTYEERLAAERQERKAQADIFQTTMRTVAEILSYQWIPGDYEDERYGNNGGRLKGDNGIIIWCHLGTYGYGKDIGRVEAMGGFPKNGRAYDQKTRSITFAVTKTAAQIAKDIERRLLPTYLPDLAKAMEREASHNDYEARKEQTLVALAAAFGLAVPSEDTYRRDNLRFGHGKHDFYGNVAPRGDGKADLEIRGISLEQAQAIAKVLGF